MKLPKAACVGTINSRASAWHVDPEETSEPSTLAWIASGSLASCAEQTRSVGARWDAQILDGLNDQHASSNRAIKGFGSLTPSSATPPQAPLEHPTPPLPSRWWLLFVGCWTTSIHSPKQSWHLSVWADQCRLIFAPTARRRFVEEG